MAIEKSSLPETDLLMLDQRGYCGSHAARSKSGPDLRRLPFTTRQGGATDLSVGAGAGAGAAVRLPVPWPPGDTPYA